MTSNYISTAIAVCAFIGTAVNGYIGWRRRRFISIREQEEMGGSIMDKLRHILFDEPTRWAELLLGMVKMMLGLSLLMYLWDPPNSKTVLPAERAAWIGLVILLLGSSQIVVVLTEQRWPRFMVSCLATGIWIYFIGSQWDATGSVRPVLVYLPLVVFNFVVGMRIVRAKSKINYHTEDV